MNGKEVYLEAARQIADGEACSVVNATGGMHNPYAEKMLEYFSAYEGYGWPWEVERMNVEKANEMRVLALLFMAEIVADDAPAFH